MPISGLVLTLSEDPGLRLALLDALRLVPRVTVGEPRGGRLPIVTETGSIREDEALFEELVRTPGVLAVELAYHDFSDVEDFGGRPPGRRRRHLEVT